jgi:hypothetical protein
LIPRTSPRFGEPLLIAAFAIALRVAVFAVAMIYGHLSLAQYTSKGDTRSYIANAAVMCGERSWSSLDQYDLRVFPGYPALIAVVHRLGISLPLAALVVTWLSAGIAAGTAAMVFDDARVGWAMTCLIPHYLINSSLGMSETPLLAMVCIALLLLRSDRQALAGVAFAFAGMIRPMACFALAGGVLALLGRRQWRRGLILLVSAALTFAGEAIALQLWTGDALRGIRVYAQHPGAYGGHMFAWPFQSLLTTPARDGATSERVAYIWIHVVITVLACGIAAWRIKQRDQRDLISFPWLICNTAFVLCIGSVWGFRHFPRFTIPAAPAMFWTLRKALPRSAAWWGLIAAACAVMAVLGVIDSP